jgi:CO/xanthine dehydrogenase FAD-binding subunit
MVLRSRGGARTVEAGDFFTGAMSAALRPDECLEEIRWPVWPERRTGSAFTELSIRHGDFAIVAAAAQVALDAGGRCVRAAFGLAAVGQTPLAFPKLAARLIGSFREGSGPKRRSAPPARPARQRPAPAPTTGATFRCPRRSRAAAHEGEAA